MILEIVILNTDNGDINQITKQLYNNGILNMGPF